MEREVANPFTESRVSLSSLNSSSQSLLTYGDDSFSLFKRLNSNKLARSEVRVTAKQVQRTLLERVEKQIYTIDQTGHCLAQLAMDERLTQAEDPPDFWTQLRSQLSPRHQPLPTFLKTPAPTSLKSERQLLRTQLSKLQKMVKNHQADNPPREVAKPRSSVIGIFEQKKREQTAILERQQKEIEIQRAKIEKREQFLLEMELERTRKKERKQPPEKIIVRGVQYSYLPL